MRTKPMLKIVLAGALALASLSPAFAARHMKMSGACSQPTQRCISDCDQFHWCTVNTCMNGKSTPVPVWRCFEPSGLCLAPHC